MKSSKRRGGRKIEGRNEERKNRVRKKVEYGGKEK